MTCHGRLCFPARFYRVSEVLNVKEEEIEDTPTFGAKLNTDYILGMAKMEGGVKILLDIDEVLSDQEIALLEKAA